MRQKSPLLVKLGQNIHSLRVRAGLSQEALAHRADLDRTYIGGVERGERNISFLNLCRIAKALSTEPTALLHGIAVNDVEKGLE
jgi:transcriptional regulator with XRE-family HTH domain